jgi:protein-arginine kinase
MSHVYAYSAMSNMLAALGARLQRLSMGYGYQSGYLTSCQRMYLDGLVPAILTHCPLLASLEVGDQQSNEADEV